MRSWRYKRKLVFVTLLIVTVVYVGFIVHKRDKPRRGSEVPTFPAFITHQRGGSLNVDIWEDICGHKMQSLKHFPLFPHRPSTRLRTSDLQLYFRPEFENFGLRIFGYLSPIESGDYSFHVDTSETSELWLSPDSKPENSVLIANTTAGIASELDSNKNGISLLAGKRYFLEVLLKNGKYEKGKLHRLEVKWKLFPGKGNDMTKIPSDVFVHDRFGQLDGKTNAVLPMHTKRPDPSFATDNLQHRSEMYLLPFISESDSKDLFPPCDYNPSYLLKGPLKRYGAIWEMHYTSIYPFDYSDVLDKEKDFVSFGNDKLDKGIAEAVVSQVWIQLKKKQPGKYSFVQILNVEENRDPGTGYRYLVEMELKEILSAKSVRFSEYVYRTWGAQALCTPVGMTWNKSAVVNILLTTGNNQGRWILHFLDNMARIYHRTKDANFNVVIVDFDSKDIDIDNALKKAAIPSYQYTNTKGDFSRALGLQKAAEMVIDPNSVLFAIDLHLDIPYHFLDDVRKHSVQHKMAYSPVLVRLACGTTSTEPFGYWDFNGFGMMVLYKSDWDKIGGMNIKEFKDKWGGEDWEFVDRLLEAGMEVERIKMVHLFHHFHSTKGMWNRSNKQTNPKSNSNKYWYE